MSENQGTEWPVLKRYDRDHLARIALPLGGIGTGTVSPRLRARSKIARRSLPCTNSIAMKNESLTFPRSKIWAMFACVSCTAIFASSMNIVMNSWSSAIDGRMRVVALDVPSRKVELLVDEEELARRRAAWHAPAPHFERGFGALHAQHVTQANVGCDFDFLARGRSAGAEPEIH